MFSKIARGTGRIRTQHQSDWLLWMAHVKPYAQP
jgi:hypothetical protein